MTTKHCSLSPIRYVVGLCLAGLCLSLLSAGTIATAAPPESPLKQAQPKPSDQDAADKDQIEFIRLIRNEKEVPTAMEVAIVRCKPRGNEKGQATVDLIGAVHVAEKSYYEQLNREFRQYDAVLYELVAPKGAKVTKGHGSSNHPVSLLQNGMKSILKLEFQLDEIDYGQDNMVHADMTPKQFAQSMKQRGESVFTMFLRMMTHAMTQQQGNNMSDAQLLFALFQKDRALALKRVLAEQFEDMGGSFAAMEGPKGSTIISGRNGVALKVLREQLDKGKRKIAIFYGAGHMDDFRKRLEKDFNLVPSETRWVVAWNMSSAKPKSPKDSDADPAAVEQSGVEEEAAEAK